jgi:hypothetical protein
VAAIFAAFFNPLRKEKPMKRDEYLLIGFVYTLIIALGLLWPHVRAYLPTQTREDKLAFKAVPLPPAGQVARVAARYFPGKTMKRPVDTGRRWNGVSGPVELEPVRLAHGTSAFYPGKAVSESGPAGPRKTGSVETFPVS